MRETRHARPGGRSGRARGMRLLVTKRTSAQSTEQKIASTTWGYRRVKISQPPAGPASQRAEGARQKAAPGAPFRWIHRSRVPMRDKLTLQIHYRGGGECWVEVRARGSVGRFHGATPIVEVLQEITCNGPWEPPARKV